MSHELRTPLANQRAALDVTLADPDATAAELRSAAEVALGQTDRANRSVDALLTLARVQSGLEPARHEPVDLMALVTEAVDRVREEEGSSRPWHLHLVPVTVPGDAELLDRAVGNLLQNAERHNLPGIGGLGRRPAAHAGRPRRPGRQQHRRADRPERRGRPDPAVPPRRPGPHRLRPGRRPRPVRRPGDRRPPRRPARAHPARAGRAGGRAGAAPRWREPRGGRSRQLGFSGDRPDRTRDRDDLGRRGAGRGRRGAGRRGADRPDRDGRGGRRRDGRRHPPARPGRHRHRQVAGLPRAGAPARQPGRGRHRDPGPPAPAGRARPPAAGRGGRRPARRRRVVRRAQGPLQLRLPAPHPRRRPRRPGHAGRGAAGLDGHQGARAAGVGRGGGRGQAAAASATTRRGTPTASGARSRSTTASASAPRSARSARSASPSSPARRPSAPTSSSPTTRCSRSTRSRACR